MAAASPKNVKPGFDRSATEYAWPSGLARPSDVVLVYLDLNHWISLAKAATGHPDGERHRDALAALRGAADHIVCVLGSEHYMEMSGIKDPRQRFDVAAVMEELTGFRCILSGPPVMRLEYDEAFKRLAGDHPSYTPVPLNDVPLLGRGVLRALGRRGGLRIRSATGEDVTEEVRLRYPGGPDTFDRMRWDSERLLDRSVLRGPTDAEAPALRKQGWNPTVARLHAERRAQQEREFAARLEADPRWRRGRLRDAVAARYVALESEPIFEEAQRDANVRLAGVATEIEIARSFTDSMPSADVRISLLTAAHRNPQTRWSSNDIFDIDALSFAVPYCDIVATERHAHHVLRTHGLPERLGTTVVATLDDAVAAL